MYKMLCIVLATIIMLGSTKADDYTITSSGINSEKKANAVSLFQRELVKNTNETTVSYIPNIASSRELIGLLDDEKVDIAIIPFEVIPKLANSPLLKPFLAKNASKVRQAIDSEVGAYNITDMEREGYRILDIWHISSTIFASNLPVESVRELQGRQVFDGSSKRDETLIALGASPAIIPSGEIFAALSAGAIDSSVIPFDDRSIKFGFNQVVDNYVDRLYRPQLYAVVVTDSIWKKMSFPDQHYLSKAATSVGQTLVSDLDREAELFKTTQIQNGAIFAYWNSEDIQLVKQASLVPLNPEGPPQVQIERQLIDIAFRSAAADISSPLAGEPLPERNIKVFFATDRKSADLSKPETAFSSLRNLSGHTYGTADVTLKRGRKLGDTLSKVSTIHELNRMKELNFFQSVSGTSDEVIVFIHGYNNSFTDSIRRGATIQEDIAKNATVISYTWPSDGEVLSYGYDESSIDTAEQNFKRFMDKLTHKVPSNKIHIIAHSMGSRLLTKYIANLPERALLPTKTKFKNLVFAAADISTEFFKQKEESPFIPNYQLSVYAQNLTIYSSQYDRPVNLSRKLHRDQRLGLADQNSIYVNSDVSAVDASSIDPARWYQRFTFATRHSYVFDKEAGVRELLLLFSGIEPDARPGMRKKIKDGMNYWQLSP